MALYLYSICYVLIINYGIMDIIWELVKYSEVLGVYLRIVMSLIADYLKF